MGATVSSAPVTRIDCAWLLADPGSAVALCDQRIGFDGACIGAIAPLPDAVPGRRRLALPPLANAHDHARTFRSATLGAFGQPLETWLPFLGVVPGMDPYLCAATSFARSLRNGVIDLMVHYTRVQGGMPYVEEACAVGTAARDVGVRIDFAVAMRDRNGIGYCDDASMLSVLRPGLRDAVAARLALPPTTPQHQLALVDDVAQMATEAGFGDHMEVQYGPTGVQWCSTALLEAIAAASAATGRRVHMHLLETRYQRTWADETHPGGVLRFLDSIGLLTPRLTLAHCTWARSDELSLLAERGVTIAVNTSSNLGLRSGIAPVPEMIRLGCKVAMGLDGMAFDEDDDALREARLGYALHRGWGYDTSLSAAQWWRFASGARIAKGSRADMLLLDWDALDDDALFGDVDPLDLLLARGSGRHIDTVIAGGRQVVAAGKVCGVDEPAQRAELLARMRSAIGSDDAQRAWRAKVQAMAEDLGPFYRQGLFRSCCSCG